MNKRAIALLTSFLMVASAATPAFADTYDTTEQTSVVQDSGTEAPAEETPTEEAAEEAPAEEAPDEGDTTEPSEEAPEDAPSEDVSEGDEGQSDEDVQPEVNEDGTPVEDTSDEEKPAEEAPAEEAPAEETVPDEEKPTEDTEDEISDRPTEDTVTEETTEDAATEDDLLLTDEAVFGKDSDWMSVSGNVLTIKGEIKDIGSSGLAAYLSTYGIVDNITTIKTVSGAKAPVNSYGLFKQFPNLTTADLTDLDLSQATSMTSFFYDCPKLKTVTFSQSTVNANKVKTMTTMFRNCPSLTTLNNFQSVQVNSIVDMEYMFAGCTSLTYIRTPFTSNSNAVNISSMFSGCSALTGIYMCVNLSNSSTTWTNAFSGCDKLTYINNWIGSPTIPTSAALPNSTDRRWYSYADDKYTVVSGTGDTASFKMTTPSTNSLWYRRSWYVFNSSSGLFTIQGAVPVDGDHSVAVLAGVSVASVKRINYTNGASVTGNARDMFENLTNLTQVDLDNFDVSGATTMAWWFSGCSSLQTVNCENWNCTKVTSMYAMFFNCKKLTSVPDIASWST
ncbi:MAG: BspA family leucine-rich repeat surface protein, partial [Oscillospiraceae bacterium]|nr:BspA family leucine-rich repeat surface protein [Oscillospiraceae bacterium]